MKVVAEVYGKMQSLLLHQGAALDPIICANLLAEWNAPLTPLLSGMCGPHAMHRSGSRCNATLRFEINAYSVYIAS